MFDQSRLVQSGLKLSAACISDMEDEIALSVVSVTDKRDTGAFALYCL
jgi:hypothetical protein